MKKKTVKERIVFDNYHDTDDFKDYREGAFECWGADCGWNYARDCAEEIPDDEVFRYIASEDNFNWEAEEGNMRIFLAGGHARKYSRLPQFAHKAYGRKKTEYEPD